MSQQPYSYRPNMNRNVTRKWAEARKVNYDSGWGDDDDEEDGYGPQPGSGPIPGAGQPYQPQPYAQPPHLQQQQQQFYGQQRSFTNPGETAGRMSFDRGLNTEQRVFSASGVPTPSQLPFAQEGRRPSPAGSAARPDSRGSANQFPPRTMSLGQQSRPSMSSEREEEPKQEADTKPLPFVRPADIYRRHIEEEERRSQESSRHSLDSSSDNKDADDTGSRRRQPTLEPVAERKSEYLDNLVAAPSSQTPVITAAPAALEILRPVAHQPDVQPTSSFRSVSSRYTDQQELPSDPPSALPSPNVSLAAHQTPSQQALPAISRASTFGSDMFRPESNSHPAEPLRGRAQSDEESLLRSNTTSTTNRTEDISPIVSRNPDPALPGIHENQESVNFDPPKRFGTTRKESPSPARRPISMEAPRVAEPQSAVSVGDSSQRLDETLPVGIPLHAQDSSDPLNQRSASEEWEQWNAARKEAHERHHIPDSKPTTPGPHLSGRSTPAHTTSTEPPAGIAALPPTGIAALPSQRPQASRDESFRPVLPGGWQSNMSIPTAAPAQVSSLHEPATAPALVNRSESAESIPTAHPPKQGWKSEYTTSQQATAFIAASAAGAALAGIFNGPALTSQGSGSEGSSVADHYDGPTGRHKDVDTRQRDFAATPEPPVTSEKSNTRDFAEDTTPKAISSQFPGAAKDPVLTTRSADKPRADSPTKSEHWWSDNEDDPAPAPAPLRTSRLSTYDAAPLALSTSRREEPEIDPDQLHSDIVQSLTPKSSNVEFPPTDGRASPIKSAGPPFAAAALAVSPASKAKALEQQNDWQPLSASTPKSESPAPSALNAASLTHAPAQKPVAVPSEPHELHDASSPTRDFASFGEAPALEAFMIPGNTKPAASAASGAAIATSPHGYPSKATANEAATVDHSRPPPAINVVSELDTDSKRSMDRQDPGPITPVAGVSLSSKSPQIGDGPVETRPFPEAKVPVSNITNMESSTQRLQAYQDNRDLYSEPVGQLENWLMYMHTSENHDIFSAMPPVTAHSSSPAHKRQESTSTGMGQMKEDVQNIKAAASKYGAKASVLGKGLFSKGREKFRNVSSGQKASRERTTDENDAVQPAVSVSIPPQIPTPNTVTPLEESSLATYFATREAPKAAAEPTVATIPEAQSPERHHQKPSASHLSPESKSTIRATDTPQRTDTLKSSGGVSAIVTDEPRKSAELLIPVKHSRRDSSISDVSSMSDQEQKGEIKPTDSRISRTISPPIDQPLVPTEEASKPREAAAMVSIPSAKAEEARKDQAEEDTTTLPTYEAPKPPRIGPGAKIVPIAAVSSDGDHPQPGTQRPFSFAGSESILGHGTNQSLNSMMNSSPIANTNEPPLPQSGPSPLPSARRNPEELARKAQTAEDFARLRQQPPPIKTETATQEEFRIPGPYGQQLRSPRQKQASPIIPDLHRHEYNEEHIHGGPAARHDHTGEHTLGGPAAASGIAFAAVEAARRQNGDRTEGPLQHPVHPQGQQPLQHYTVMPPADARDNYGQQPMHQQRPIQPDYQQPMYSERDKPRGRGMITSLFGGQRSKSGSRNLNRQSPQPQMQSDHMEQGSARRSSFLGLGGPKRASTMAPTLQGVGNDNFVDHSHGVQKSDRPSSGRRLSKDMFKDSSGSQAATPVSGKKKRFSGLFGKSKPSEGRGPQRASTLPLNSSNRIPGRDSPNPQYYRQATIPEHANQQRGYQPGPQQGPAQFQSPHNYNPPAEGYYGGRSASQDQSIGPRPQDRYSTYSNNSYQPPSTGNMYQHENRAMPAGYGYENDMVKRPITQTHPNDFSSVRPDQRPPPGAYQHEPTPQDSPFSADTFRPTHNQRPSLPRINTGDRVAGPSTAPVQYQRSPFAQEYRPPSTRANRDISYTAPVTTPKSSSITPRVAALHTRSRSPKLGRRSSEDLTAAYDALRARSPADNLGTFTNKSVSPIGISRSAEEQEKPWTINLPGQNEEPTTATSTKAREMRRIMLERSGSSQPVENKPTTVAEKFLGVANPPAPDMGSTALGENGLYGGIGGAGTMMRAQDTTQVPAPGRMRAEDPIQDPAAKDSVRSAGSAREANTGAIPAVRTVDSTPSPMPAKQVPTSRDAGLVHEMPGSRPDGYESEEEPMMSATAYPGQEWQPVFERWDD